MPNNFPLSLRCLVITGSLLFFNILAQAQHTTEAGELREFMGGTAPGSSYDNWISHVVEGIARPGYNDYGPVELDIQTTGFGSFEVLENNTHGDAVLQLFRDVCLELLQGNAEAAQDLLDNGVAIDYELVAFQDTTYNRDYLMLRELLNPAHVDEGISPSPTDDVIGSFDHGWGIFIFSPQASRPEMVIQAPHPCDDFPSPFLAVDLFQLADAGVLMINGAGREVAHSGDTYNNGRSLSDPTRNCLLPFHVIHESVTDFWQDAGSNELIVQLHTYDDGAHRNLKSMVVVGGRHNRIHNPVLFDTGGGRKGLLGNLSQPVFQRNQLGWDHEDWLLQDYLASNALYPVYLDGGIPDSLIALPVSPDLWGYGSSCQFSYTYPDEGGDYPECTGIERAVHMELDELPTPAHVVGLQVFYALPISTPPTWQNFSHSRQFCMPVFAALIEARDSLAVFEDLAAPTTPQNLQLTGFSASSLKLRWTPSLSTNFSSYEVLVDSTGEISENAVVHNLDEISELCWAGTRTAEIDGLSLLQNYALTIRARDSQNRLSSQSNVIQGMPDDLDPPDITIIEQAAAFSDIPVLLSVRIQDETGIQSTQLFYRLNGGEWISNSLLNSGGTLYRSTLPAQSAGTQIEYYATASDLSGHANSSTSDVAQQQVLYNLYSHDFEGEQLFSHTPIEDATDQWHLSQQDSWQGERSWKFGATDGGNYTNDAGGWLTSNEWLLPIGVTNPAAQFWLRIDAEASGSAADSCYDGLTIQQQINGADWESCELTPQWTHHLRSNSDVVLDWPQPMLSGTTDWLVLSVTLPPESRRVALRFGFVSDGSVTEEGIYLDALRIGAEIPENPELVTELDLELLPGARIQLRWIPVVVATSYRIYQSDSAQQFPLEPMVETSSTDWTLNLRCCVTKNFFRVTAVVPDALLLDAAPNWQPNHGLLNNRQSAINKLWKN